MEGMGKEALIEPITGAPSPSVAFNNAAPVTATSDAGTLGRNFGRIMVVAKVPSERAMEEG
jgi:hypothetical protein